MPKLDRVFSPEDAVYASVSLYFDPRAVDCAHCPILETYARKQCRYTGEYIVNDKSVGMFCPLEITIEDKNKILTAKEKTI